MKIQSIFISRNLDAKSYLRSVTKLHSISLQDYPLIETKALHFAEKVILPQADWVFFSSKNTVKYFFECCQIKIKYKYGCIGSATAKELDKYNTSADFVGDKVEIERVTEKFARVAGDAKVIFPQSNVSLRTIQKRMAAANVIDLILYNTLPIQNMQTISADILVFTSPSNVNSYFFKNTLLPHQKIIAIGFTTANALETRLIVCVVSENTSEEAIWEAILIVAK